MGLIINILLLLLSIFSSGVGYSCKRCGKSCEDDVNSCEDEPNSCMKCLKSCEDAINSCNMRINSYNMCSNSCDMRSTSCNKHSNSCGMCSNSCNKHSNSCTLFSMTYSQILLPLHIRAKPDEIFHFLNKSPFYIKSFFICRPSSLYENCGHKLNSDITSSGACKRIQRATCINIIY